MKYLVNTNEYHFRGLYDHSMCVINMKNKTKQNGNIFRGLCEENTKNEINIFNLHNSCSSRDSLDMDLIQFENEENFIYFAEDRSFVDDDLTKNYTLKIMLTFSAASKHHEKEVVEYLLKKTKGQERNIETTIETKYIDTFNLTSTDLEQVISQWGAGMLAYSASDKSIRIDTPPQYDKVATAKLSKEVEKYDSQFPF